MDAKPGSSRSRQAQARRAQILDAALALFASQGYAATSTRQIAQRLGISEGLLFHYFPTKLSLMQALAERRHDLALAGLAGNAPVGDPKAGVLEQMTNLALRVLRLMHQEAPLFTLLLAESLTNAETGAASLVMMESDAQGLVRFLQARIAAGELRADLPVPLLVESFLGGLLLFFLRQRGLPAAEWEAAAQAYAPHCAALWYAGARVAESATSSHSQE